MKAKPFEIMQENDKVNISRGFQIDARIGSTKTAKLQSSCECCLMNTGCTDLLGSLEQSHWIDSYKAVQYLNTKILHIGFRFLKICHSTYNISNSDFIYLGCISILHNTIEISEYISRCL